MNKKQRKEAVNQLKKNFELHVNRLFDSVLDNEDSYKNKFNES